MQAQSNQQQRVLQQQPQPQAASIQHGQEIKQESLKTTIQSAITDLEQDIDKTVVDSVGKENQAPLPQQQQVKILSFGLYSPTTHYKINHESVQTILYLKVFIIKLFR